MDTVHLPARINTVHLHCLLPDPPLRVQMRKSFWQTKTRRLRFHQGILDWKLQQLAALIVEHADGAAIKTGVSHAQRLRKHFGKFFRFDE